MPNFQTSWLRGNEAHGPKDNMGMCQNLWIYHSLNQHPASPAKTQGTKWVPWFGPTTMWWLSWKILNEYYHSSCVQLNVIIASPRSSEAAGKWKPHPTQIWRFGYTVVLRGCGGCCFFLFFPHLPCDVYQNMWPFRFISDWSSERLRWIWYFTMFTLWWCLPIGVLSCGSREFLWELFFFWSIWNLDPRNLWGTQVFYFEPLIQQYDRYCYAVVTVIKVRVMFISGF